MRIYSFYLLFVLFVCASCTMAQKNQLEGEGGRVERTIDLPSIDGIGLAINANVYLSQGQPQSVRMVGQENVLNNIESDVSGGTWEIGFDKGMYNYERVDIYITLSDLEEISLASSGNIKGETPFKGLDDLKINIAASGDVELDVEADDLEFNSAASGTGHLSGSAEQIEVNIAGSGKLKGFDLQVNSCTTNIAGSGNCEISVSESIYANIVGSGDVIYSGNPNKVQSNSLGSGKLKKQ